MISGGCTCPTCQRLVKSRLAVYACPAIKIKRSARVWWSVKSYTSRRPCFEKPCFLLYTQTDLKSTNPQVTTWGLERTPRLVSVQYLFWKQFWFKYYILRVNTLLKYYLMCHIFFLSKKNKTRSVEDSTSLIKIMLKGQDQALRIYA